MSPCVQYVSAESADLYSHFGQSDLGGQLFAAVDVRVVRLVERLLKLVQLVGRERRPVASVLLALRRVVVVVVVAATVAATVADLDAVAQRRRRRLPVRFAVARSLCRPAERLY